MIMAMTSTATETLSDAVARRLREQMGGRKITQKRLGELTGWSAMYISRRYNGDTAFDIRDLETIEAVTGISPTLLLTGHGEEEAIDRRTNPAWVDGAVIDGGTPGEFAVRVAPPTPDSHPMRRRTDRLLQSVPNPRGVRASDSAMAYVKLAESSLLPRLDSNQEPSDCGYDTILAVAS